MKINHFTQFRATYGDDDANRRLQRFSDLLFANCRPDDVLARLDDSEFGMLLPDCNVEQAKNIVSRLKKGCGSFVEISAGVCAFEGATSLDYSMAHADQEMGLG